MAAYAALVSVMHIIDQIEHHPRPPISLYKTQVESLTENVTFLQGFLEGYSQHVGYSKEADELESRIADAAYAAEDVIESHIVDQILARCTTHDEEISSIEFYQDLQKVIEHMDWIKKEVMEIKEKTGSVHDQLHRNSTPAASLRSSSAGQNTTMVGFDDVLIDIMDKLTGGQPDRQIIPIVGMGGIGKTTLARNIYQNQVVVQHFPLLGWATISQEYNMRDIILQLLQEGGGKLRKMNEYELGDERKLRKMNEYELGGDERKLREMSEYELGDVLHKRLSGRRYLIIVDDIWDFEVWDRLKFLFPDNKNGSRIMLTTRLSNLASYVTDSVGIAMAFLDEKNSWNLFSKTVFGKEGCPLELKEIGKKIVRNCKGLPLSIIVIGGLLAKSEHTREYWEYIAENLNSVVNLEEDELCLKILHTSYNELPVYLKPCFLYMGVFPEDSVIHVSMLVNLWAAEGFLKPVSGKSMEEVAREYLKELINRNLILVHKLGTIGNIKHCNIHDLVRDLCLRESQKERLYNVTRQHNLNAPDGINTQRRIVTPKSTSKVKVLNALQSMSLARSLVSYSDESIPLAKFGLLRILKTWGKYSSGPYFLENMFWLVNSRYLDVRAPEDFTLPSSVYLLWNLHTLIVGTRYENSLIAPAEIWSIPQLRHVIFRDGLYLPDPPSGNVGRRDNDIVLENLQTLMRIRNFKCGEEVVKRIPNIKKLKVSYHEEFEEGLRMCCLDNLGHLHQLESFSCYSTPKLKPNRADFLLNLSFPHSLKKLTIESRCVHWEDMLEKIGSLPLLEKLKIIDGSFREHKWETVEGQFRSLKYLLMWGCWNLGYWMTESSHFPRLKRLVLEGLVKLKEIPLEIGEIPTLQSIELIACRKSAVVSVEKILEEQEELHGEVALQVRVIE